MFYEDIDCDTDETVEEYVTYLVKPLNFAVDVWEFSFDVGMPIKAIWQYGNIWHVSPTAYKGSLWVEVDSSYLALT